MRRRNHRHETRTFINKILIFAINLSTASCESVFLLYFSAFLNSVESAALMWWSWRRSFPSISFRISSHRRKIISRSQQWENESNIREWESGQSRYAPVSRCSRYNVTRAPSTLPKQSRSCPFFSDLPSDTKHFTASEQRRASRNEEKTNTNEQWNKSASN